MPGPPEDDMKPPGASSAVARRSLAPFSILYGGVIALRNLYYDRIRAASRAASVPVVSIGNLTVGGTGKTPLTIELVRRLVAAGARPAILTRGYGAAGGETADEVLEFRLVLPDVPVIVNPDRVAGAATAQREYDTDCLVLDDGFQHRRLRRDLDVVLIDALDPWGGGWLLPAGRLREPLRSLRRAEWIVITRSNQADAPALQNIVVTLSRYATDVPVTCADVEADALVALDGRRRPLASLVGVRVLPVCGLGNPTTFLQLVAQTQARLCEPLVFPDHHRYSLADVAAIAATAGQRGAKCVVTTRKDWVKLQRLWSAAADAAKDVELLRLDTRLELVDPQGAFDARLRRLLERRVWRPGAVPGPE
jgi:tetraacyldisaccharide 4'-kinase